MRTGEATWDEALLLFLERSGYVEETYHTFSYSPLADDDGRDRGDAVRRQRGHRAGRSASAGSRRCATSAPAISGARDRGRGARRGRARTSTPTRARCRSRSSTSTTRTARAWPRTAGTRWTDPSADDRGRRASTHAILVDDIDALDPPTGAWDEPPLAALVAPAAGQRAAMGFLVAGLNRYRALDEGYRGFVELVAGQIAAGLTNARAYEEERLRAERAARARRGQDRVLHQRQPRAAHAADAAARPGRGRARRRRRRRCGASSASASSSSTATPQRLLKLVNTLLDFSRLQSGRVNAAYAPIDLAPLHGRAGEHVRVGDRARRPGRWTIDCAAAARSRSTSTREMWAKIVLNLLSNALKFTFTGGITVRLYADRRRRPS